MKVFARLVFVALRPPLIEAVRRPMILTSASDFPISARAAFILWDSKPNGEASKEFWGFVW